MRIMIYIGLGAVMWLAMMTSNVTNAGNANDAAAEEIGVSVRKTHATTMTHARTMTYANRDQRLRHVNLRVLTVMVVVAMLRTHFARVVVVRLVMATLLASIAIPIHHQRHLPEQNISK
eukprot:CAMPEP_0202705308 /NCGR_PEP_ID=MMETSP1385-20130828/17874_1 /ASSEMBLY_ACC=CAM_ASM_000861 /TAXON_ID=933848 /ORGANISM="Elphidium margaritaceum" /LENGTH=118 /DNA_ID=CAMNT_0049363513 /DNA_START=181 /DNA_END=537 /DNA_ORIENTATION=-